MTPLTCAELDDVAAELALGVLPGNVRAPALAHLDRCQECRRTVADLASAADTILAAAPAIAPPRGFARKAVKSFSAAASATGQARTRPRPAATVALAVASVAVALALSLAAPRLPGPWSNPTPAANGPTFSSTTVRIATLAPAPGEGLGGVALVKRSGPAWLLMAVSDDDDGSYVCDVHYADGRTVRVGSFSVERGAGAWRQDLPASRSPISAVDVLTTGGALAARATFR